MSATQPTSSAGTGWPDVLALAERELELVRGGDAAALPAATAERGALAATLGPAPRHMLEQLAEVQQQILVELTLARDEIVRELHALQRGRGAVRGYRATATR
jgi:hypothetical protein